MGFYPGVWDLPVEHAYMLILQKIQTGYINFGNLSLNKCLYNTE